METILTRTNNSSGTRTLYGRVREHTRELSLFFRKVSTGNCSHCKRWPGESPIRGCTQARSGSKEAEFTFYSYCRSNLRCIFLSTTPRRGVPPPSPFPSFPSFLPYSFACSLACLHARLPYPALLQSHG